MRRSLLFVAIAVLAVIVLLTLAKGPDQVATVGGTVEGTVNQAGQAVDGAVEAAGNAVESAGNAVENAVAPAVEAPVVPATEAPVAPATEAPSGLAPDVTASPGQGQ
jgi:maltose-binding protein MalE